MFVQAREEAGGTINYYFLKDHLGNIRVIFKDNNGVAEVVSAKDYYPFGSVMRSMQAIPDEQDKWKYQGKERDLETGYDYFEARLYDSMLGRFLQVDPMAEKFRSMNPYTGMFNNPLNVIDPDGMQGRMNFDIRNQSGSDEEQAEIDAGDYETSQDLAEIHERMGWNKKASVEVEEGYYGVQPTFS